MTLLLRNRGRHPPYSCRAAVTAFPADAELYPVENNEEINLKYLEEQVYSQPWPNDDRNPVLSRQG